MEPRLVGAPSSWLDAGLRPDASDFVASPRQSRDNRGYPDFDTPPQPGHAAYPGQVQRYYAKGEPDGHGSRAAPAAVKLVHSRQGIDGMSF